MVTATLTWDAPATYEDGEPIAAPVTYDVYGFLGHLGDNKLVLLQSGLAAPTATVSGDVGAGSIVCFAVRAVVNGVPSRIGDIVCAAVNPGASQ